MQLKKHQVEHPFQTLNLYSHKSLLLMENECSILNTVLSFMRTKFHPRRINSLSALRLFILHFYASRSFLVRLWGLEKIFCTILPG